MSRAAIGPKAEHMTPTIRQIIPLGALLWLAACESTPKAIEGTRPIVSLPPAPHLRTDGLEAVMGHTANGLTAAFGKPEQDLREANGRRLQFVGGGCVLDAYLYPPQTGREAVVTYTEARLADGRDTDRAGCVNAMLRARGR